MTRLDKLHALKYRLDMQPAIYLSEGNSKEPYWWMTRFTYGQFIGNLREIRRIVNELIRDENMESEEAENGKHS